MALQDGFKITGVTVVNGGGGYGHNITYQVTARDRVGVTSHCKVLWISDRGGINRLSERQAKAIFLSRHFLNFEGYLAGPL